MTYFVDKIRVELVFHLVNWSVRSVIRKDQIVDEVVRSVDEIANEGMTEDNAHVSCRR